VGKARDGYGARLCAEHQPQHVGWLTITDIQQPLRLVCDTAALHPQPAENRFGVSKRGKLLGRNFSAGEDGVRILPTKSWRFEPLNQLAGAPVCDRLLTLANPKAGYKPALRLMGTVSNRTRAAKINRWPGKELAENSAERSNPWRCLGSCLPQALQAPLR